MTVANNAAVAEAVYVAIVLGGQSEMMSIDYDKTWHSDIENLREYYSDDERQRAESVIARLIVVASMRDFDE